ncbi:hypothetical protein ACP4OV_024073 [Aristida adscensionis]
MAPKRKPAGEGTAEEFADPEDERKGSSAEFAKPVYLVAEREDEQSPYSVLKVDADAVAGGDKPPRARVVAGMPGTERGMSFVAAHSRHGSWIVGVGGELSASSSVAFDPSTLKTHPGPPLLSPKHEPVLISHRGVVYAISRRPRVVGRMDSEPWFECLSFNKGAPSQGWDWDYWKSLPSPPFFPSFLNPYQFRNPPEITVTSYVAVGSHILISPQQELMVGTYAFDVGKKTWEKVHDKNLPFIGQAVPLGGSLFAACPVSSNDAAASASVFNIKVSLSTMVEAASTPTLTIQEFPVVASEGRIPQPLICPLGVGRFCSVRWGSFRRSRRNANFLKEIRVILATFWTENIEAILTACQSNGAEAKDLQVTVQVKEQSHTYKSKGRSRLLESASRLVAALSMDTENIEMCEGETTKTGGSQTTKRFKAPVILGWAQSGVVSNPVKFLELQLLS